MDEFDGREGASLSLLDSELRVLGRREEPYFRNPALRLFHLYGAATWLRHGDEVLKVHRLQKLRDLEVFDLWAAGVDVGVSPVVVLGDRKERLVARAPFDDQYASLSASVSQAEEVVLAGYAFRDIPLNSAIRRSLSSTARVTVVNPAKDIRAIAAAALPLKTSAEL